MKDQVKCTTCLDLKQIPKPILLRRMCSNDFWNAGFQCMDYQESEGDHEWPVSSHSSPGTTNTMDEWNSGKKEDDRTNAKGSNNYKNT